MHQSIKAGKFTQDGKRAARREGRGPQREGARTSRVAPSQKRDNIQKRAWPKTTSPKHQLSSHFDILSPSFAHTSREIALALVSHHRTPQRRPLITTRPSLLCPFLFYFPFFYTFLCISHLNRLPVSIWPLSDERHLPHCTLRILHFLHSILSVFPQRSHGCRRDSKPRHVRKYPCSPSTITAS